MSTSGNISPYERLYSFLPNYKMLRAFGCICFIQPQPHEHNKLEHRAHLCGFLGYEIEHKGYRCWDPISKRLRVSHHVPFGSTKCFHRYLIFKFQIQMSCILLIP